MKKGNKKTRQSKEEKHKKVLTKNNFIQGAFISTLGIVVSKILGIVYVIPFHAIVKEQGGALYGYAYTIYSLFLALSSAGIPLAISKIISEYQTLGYYNAKERAFKIGKQLSIVLGLIAFIILFIFAPEVAHLILGDLKGGNTIEQVTYVIRVISTAILVVPILSIYRGYLEGHKYLTPSSISNVIEQVVRVTLIILGSYLSMKVFHLSLETTVGIAVFGATAGALISYFYLLDITHKSKKELQEKPLKIKEPKITNKAIVKKIFIYALPFIMIDIFKSMYDFIDMSTVVKTIGDMSNYSTKDAESIMSVISTWGSKFNMIISSVSTGIIVSLIPTLTASFVVGNQEDINKKVNQTFQILLLFTMPMTVGLSMLAKPVWMIFYGPSKFGAPVFSYFIYVSLFMSLYTTAVTIIQTLKDYKTVFISLFVGATLKLLLNVSLMNSFNKMGLPPFYGNISATIIGYLVSLIICLYVLHERYKINYEVTVKEIFNITCATVIMGLVLFLLRFVIPEVSSNRLVNLPIIVVYTLVGAIIYFIVIYKSKTLHTIFGENNLKKITNKLFKKRSKGASK